jgi:NADH-quinone oxidoreductase subunit I/NAD(P)H-quinone oxidoreductase subunit I
MDSITAVSPLKKTRSTYFGRIKNAITSILEGMSVTFGYLLQRPITIQYPDRVPKPIKETLPERYRGILDVDMSICTACLACERACPIECIKIEVVKDTETKKRFMTRFDIDIAKCMYCGLCTEPCPSGAIFHTKEFEGSTRDVQYLVRRFVAPGQKIEPHKIKKEKPAVKKPAAKAPGADKPAGGDKPAADAATGEKPAASPEEKKPAADAEQDKKPADDKPAAE